VIREKELAFDSASERIRRCERRIDQSLPRHRGSRPSGPEVNVHDFYDNARERRDAHAMAATPDEDFDTAIDEYLSRTSSESRTRLAAAMRRLEIRVGELRGPRCNPSSR
jgi:hypothetical protein